ncbi:ABC transporter permease [Rhizobium sp. Root73]|uniref:ABC transporter permease n=1 Tax=unclassified Rhizobium TaxID=2613769 RepID=UPI0007139551|nr:MULTISPECIES: ABC transporter permease [unclassified Rhizobium]KQV34877.1 ABC transporter permease [Rhizobium sp. Root1204]KQY00539.1 ABC transporter permease [Rhizobium sp. Root1334]KRC03886.1 ABC transporter permease [Rhizobium sp. Root73]
MSALVNSTLFRRVSKVPPSYYLLVVLLVILFIARPQMLNANVLGVFVRQVVPLGILVLGQLLVMRVKSIDLSGGGVILLINYCISSGIFPGASLGFYVVLALAIGLAIGLFNGMMVAKRRVSAVIVTLALSIVLVGFVQYLSSGKPPGDVPKIFAELFNTRFIGLPSPVLFWIALTALMALLLSQTVFGRCVAAVGESIPAAHFSGVPVERTVILAHTLAGLMAAIAALVQTASIAVGSVRVGLDLPILSVAATILGGVVFGRGEGGVWGPFFGVLCFAFLFVVMTMFGVGDAGKLVAQGLIILFAAIFYGLRAGK